MVYETFLKTIHTMVQERLGTRAQVSLQRVLTNNGLRLDGLSFSAAASALSPTGYLNSYYDEAERGLPLSIITEQIVLLYETDPGFPEELGARIRSLDQIQDQIVYRLINAGENEILLSGLPHIPYLDLAIVFSVIVAENSARQMSALIHRSHLNLWGISQEELGQLAERNTPRLLPARIDPIERIIGLAGCPDPDPDSRIPLYVMSNDRGINGAACLLYPGILKEFAARFDDDLVVLPSSIHEVLLTPLKTAFPPAELNEMIRFINRSDVPREDRLSDHIYCYSRSQNCLYIPAGSTLTPSGADETKNPQ